MFNKARFRNKLIQQLYSPNRNGLFSRETMKAADDMEKELDKAISGVFGKKKRKKSTEKKSGSKSGAKSEEKSDTP